MINQIFCDETFYFTSDPDVSLVNVLSLPEDYRQAIPISHAVAIFGGKITPIYDPQVVTAVVISPQKRIFFEEFQGKRIFGTKYIIESIEQERPLPKSNDDEDGYILLSHCLENVFVSCDEDTFAKMGQELSQCIRLMSGTFLPHILHQHSHSSTPSQNKLEYCLSITQNFSESYFICRKSYCKEYESALKSFSEILRPSWVTDCFSSLEKLPVTSLYVLPPLAGCLISVTGFSLISRQYIQQIVVSLGGSFSPEFSTSCTHLITYNTNSEKFAASKKWNIPAISLDWLFNVVNYGHYVPLKDFIKRAPQK